MRHAKSLDWLRAITSVKIDNIEIWAGTVIDPKEVSALVAMGITTIVSPGFDEEVAAACTEQKAKLIPGVATPTEIIRALRAGFSLQKMFPAELLGGTTYLKAMLGPFPQVKFIATGGITEKNWQSYEPLENVVGVAGSYLDV